MSNGCPSCGWFSSEISEWLQWDGKDVGMLAEMGPLAVRRRKPLGAGVAVRSAVCHAKKCLRVAPSLWPAHRRKRELRSAEMELRLRHGQWRCTNCTLVNERTAVECEVCEQPRVR